MVNSLVTGGAGFIGSHIVEKLLELGHEVRIFDDFSTGNKKNIELFKKDVEIVKGNIQIKDEVRNACKGMDYVFHEAAMTSVSESIKNPARCWKINITGTQHILNGSVKANVKRVMLASSAAVYGDSMNLPKTEDMPIKAISPYGNSKIMNEIEARKYFKEYDLETVSLRYFNVFGPRQDPLSPYSGVISKFIGMMMDRESPTVYGNGKQTRDFIYVKDVVEANILAMNENKAPGLTFNIAMGKQTSILDIIEILNGIMKKKLTPHFEPAQEGDIKHSYADITKAKELIGFEPKWELQKGLKETVKWFKVRK